MQKNRTLIGLVTFLFNKRLRVDVEIEFCMDPISYNKE